MSQKLATKPRARGLIFTDTMPALLDGSKTQTRRPVKLREFQRSTTRGYDWTFRDRRALWNDVSHEQLLAKCPHGVVGDRIYVKEAWCQASWDAVGEQDPEADDGRPRGPLDPRTELRPFAYYRATDKHVVDANDEDRSPWKSPMFMPRWAARIVLELTEVRVQLVQDITEVDAQAEIGDALHGVLDDVEICRLAKLAGCMATDSRAWFAAAWELIHGRGAWERPTWVWALTFKRVETAR